MARRPSGPMAQPARCAPSSPAVANSWLDAAVGHAVLLEVALVILLGAVERGRGGDLRHDGAAEAPGRADPLLGGGRGGLLLGRVEEAGRAILRADARRLAV